MQPLAGVANAFHSVSADLTDPDLFPIGERAARVAAIVANVTRALFRDDRRLEVRPTAASQMVTSSLMPRIFIWFALYCRHRHTGNCSYNIDFNGKDRSYKFGGESKFFKVAVSLGELHCDGL